MNNKIYMAIGAVLIIIAFAFVLLNDKGGSESSGGVAVPQPSGDDAALKNLRVN